MIRITIILITLINCVSLGAGAWQWALGFGSQGMESAWDMAVDADQGNIYVSGDFSDTLSVGGVTIPSQGLSDCFIAKFDSSGQFLWAKAFGSLEEDVCLSVALDDAGNSYFTGFCTGPVSYEGWQIGHEGLWDVFYGKLAPDGDLLWLKSFGGPLNDIGYSLAASPNGEIYITGWFAGSIDFGGGINLASYGGSDIYLAKFDTNGNPLWARHAGTEGVEYGYKVDVSMAGSYACITGSASPGSNFNSITTDAQGMFVAKYLADGSIDWVLPSYNLGAINIACDQYNLMGGNNAVIGRITGSGSVNNIQLNSVDGSDDIYIAWFDSAGNWTNVEHYGGPGSDKGRAIDIGFEHAALVSFEQTVDFGGTALNSLGAYDLGILASSHSPVSAGGANPDVGTDIKMIGPSQVAVTGWFSGAASFGRHAIQSGGETDQNVFLAVFDRLAVVSDDPQAPTPLQISCYPNPGSGDFSISAKDSDRLGVYNLRGQLVRELKPLSRQAGSYWFHWDALDSRAKRCPAGIYFLRSARSTSRLLLLNP